MSKIQPKRAYAKEIIEQFCGLRADGTKPTPTIGNFTNLRINPDGSLEKRNGWKLLEAFEGRLRGACSVELDGVVVCFVVAQQTIYLCVEGEGCFALPTELEDTDTPVQFLFYKEDIYLLDQNRIFVLNENGFDEALGYVPLYGLGWHPRDLGEPYEELNLLTPKIRVNYLNPDLDRVIYLPFYAYKIDCLMVDGNKVTDFSYGSSSRMLVLSSPGKEITVAYTFLPDDEYSNALQRAAMGIVDSVGDEEALILGGAPVEQPHLFIGTDVTPAKHAGSQLYYPKSRAIYFLNRNVVPFGSFLSPLNAVYKNRSNQLLAFTFGQTFLMKLSASSEKILSVVLINDHIGCATRNINTRLEDDPLILNTSGLFRVRLSEENELETIPIYCPYPDLTAGGFAENAIVCLNVAKNELWLRDSRDTDGVVLVYNILQKAWYRFTGIHAHLFFPYQSTVGICADNMIGRFAEDLYTDNGQAIAADLETDFLDLGEPEAQKRALRLSMTAEMDRSPVAVTLETETRIKGFDLMGKNGSAPDYFDLRAAMGRFRHLKVSVSHTAPQRFKVKRIALFANL